ncbi:hypothetical protein WA026_023182 [Henosepilachna vigintioctopunctata]|uniref:Uncharacterized protein n=1 Tax=Henosepilachna vigintioctopunctata TaxID=420089 RepID=A0AAW1UJU7_9CUCU
MPNNQQVMQGGSSAMFPGQQQAFAGQQRPQPDYRGMSQNPRQQYIQQQVPNVTINANMNPMGAQQAGAVPPYSRSNSQNLQPGMQGQPNQFQQQQQQQKQQRMRQQMVPKDSKWSSRTTTITKSCFTFEADALSSTSSIYVKIIKLTVEVLIMKISVNILVV